MKNLTHNRVWLEIDLGVLQDNYRKMVAAVAPCSVIAVLKANAYGLGVGAVAEALVDTGCRQFGVAELNEALELKKFDGSVRGVDRASCPTFSPQRRTDKMSILLNYPAPNYDYNTSDHTMCYPAIFAGLFRLFLKRRDLPLFTELTTDQRGAGER